MIISNAGTGSNNNVHDSTLTKVVDIKILAQYNDRNGNWNRRNRNQNIRDAAALCS